MTLSRGIDVSHHQGRIDWPGITRELGLTWAACKATEGGTFRDSEFARNWPAMKAAGLVRIVYHFGRPATDATAQARFFLSVVRPVAGDVLCLDLEQSDDRSQAQCNAWAKEFAAAIRKGAPGNTLVIYLGGYASNGTGAGLSDHYDYWWYPRYATMQPVTRWPGSFAPRLAGNTTGWKAPHVWQWAASLVTSQGQVDANLSPLTAAQLRSGPHRISLEDDDMAPLSVDDAKTIWRSDIIPDPTGKDSWQADTYLRKILTEVRAVRAAIDPASVAAAVVAQLPASGLTQAQIEAAFRTVLGSLDDGQGA